MIVCNMEQNGTWLRKAQPWINYVLYFSTDLDDGGEDGDTVVVSCRNSRIKEREVQL